MTQLLKVDEAAVALGISRHTLRSWIAKRRIGYVRLGRAVRITETEVKRVVRSGTVRADSSTNPNAELGE